MDTLSPLCAYLTLSREFVQVQAQGDDTPQGIAREDDIADRLDVLWEAMTPAERKRSALLIGQWVQSGARVEQFPTADWNFGSNPTRRGLAGARDRSDFRGD